MRRTDYPYWAFPTFRGFTRKKRADMREVRRAFDKLSIGAAFIPGYIEHYTAIKKHLTMLEDEMRPNNWRRKP